MSEGDTMTIQCWVNSEMESNVVTMRGATGEEGSQILTHVGESLPKASVRRDGERVTWLIGQDIIMHHYHTSGGEVELLSPSLSHEQLLDLLPEEFLGRARY